MLQSVSPKNDLPELEVGSMRRAQGTLPGMPAFALAPDRGAVLATIEYRIPAERTRDFVRTMQELRRLRLRNGAQRWSLFRDAADQ